MHDPAKDLDPEYIFLIPKNNQKTIKLLNGQNIGAALYKK
jgi:hypothetical protein